MTIPTLSPILQQRLDILKHGATGAVNAKLEAAYKKSGGDWEKTKETLSAEKVPANQIERLDFFHALADITGDSATASHTLAAVKGVSNIHDLALHHDAKSLAGLLSADMLPAHTPGTTPHKRIENYAKGIMKKVFALQPSAVLQRMATTGELPAGEPHIRKGIASFLANQPGFDIRSTSVYKAVLHPHAFKGIDEKDKAEIVSHLKNMQRVQAISPSGDAVAGLLGANMVSAHQVAEMTEASFMRTYGKLLGADDAKHVYYHSTNVKIRNEHALRNIGEAVKGTGVAMIDGPSGFEKRKETFNLFAGTQSSTLSWEKLFGSTDLCQCGDCNSVYSPAAYFVELLQFMRNNNLDIHAKPGQVIKTDPYNIDGTVLDKFFSRRPDLGCLELTCANSNTIIPYIDLVNEVLESFIVNVQPAAATPDKIDIWNTEDETTGELLAQPQHTNYEAYRTLSKAVYPFSLPYNQPVDAARIFLDYLSTSRYELLKTFKAEGVADSTGDAKAPDAGDVSALIPLNNEALARAIDAEYLGITLEEYVILTKESFWQAAFFDTKFHTTPDADRYKKTIGGQEVWNYYGYDFDGPMLDPNDAVKTGLTFVKDQFLKRTGLQYTDLVNILLTAYINPLFPKGQSQTIFESLQFGYQQLMKMVDYRATDPDAKFLGLINFLKADHPVLGSGGPVNPCNSDKAVTKIDDSVVKDWVYTNFEAIGQLIVLDSGDKPYLPISGELWIVGGNLVGYLDNYGIITNTTGAQIGHVSLLNSFVVWNDGKIHPSLDIKDGPDVIGFIFTSGQITSYLLAAENFAIRGAKIKKEGLGAFASPIVTLQLPHDSCDLEKVRLIHLDGSPLTVVEYEKIHRFIRLWRKIGWTVDETDKALTGVSDITPALLHRFAAIKKLAVTTNIELVKLLTFWADISTAGDNSLYQRLFLTHNMVSIDPVFKADDNGGYLTKTAKITDHIPVIMAAFNLKADDIATIMGYASIADSLTLPNVSAIYRNSLLMKTLNVKSYELQQVIALFGNPFASADATVTFFDEWQKMKDAGFNYRQLNYIIRGADDVNKPLTPKTLSMLQLTKTLYDGLNQIDTVDADITSDDQATADFVSSKIALLFDGDLALQIMALLLGTTSYQAVAEPKLVTDPIKFPDLLKDTLIGKLKYDNTTGNIQVTGIFTTDEVTAAKAIFSASTPWGNAIDDIYKQALDFYTNVLSAIFPDAAKAVLLQGDMNIPAPQQAHPDTPTAVTAPLKLAYFIKGFLPYLRSGLESKFITATLSGKVGLDSDTTDTLLTGVLTDGLPKHPLLETFRAIKNRPAVTSEWAGYLVPVAEDKYSFIITVSAVAPVMTINGQNIVLTNQAGTTIWVADAIKLKTGYAYAIDIKVKTGNISALEWKTDVSLKTPVPASVLYPDSATNVVQGAFIKLQKAAILVSGFKLAANEIVYLQTHATDFDGFDFNNFTLRHWLHLDGFTRLRNSLPATNTNLVLFFTWASQAADATLLSQNIANVTGWNKDDIDKLIAKGHFNLAIKDFKNEATLLKLQDALAVANKVNADINTLFDWAQPAPIFDKSHTIAENIKTTTKARYTETDWEQVVQPLNDQLRQHQRDALVNYLLVQKPLIDWGVQDADSLFEFFLIDVEMCACMETSRIKQAINSVQLFVQRCFLGLEKQFGIANDVLDKNRWQWMQREVLWVANRKVFLYPENWIEESLRDDKSPFFKELESALLQKDINTQTVEDALRSYLYKLDEVANMRVAGLFIDEDNLKIHIFSRTRHAPYLFYYRCYDVNQATWTAWEKVEVDITSYDVENSDKTISENGCYLLPVVYDNRLLIFFPHIVKKTSSAAGAEVIPAPKTGTVTVAVPVETWEIKMAWSEYRNGKWTQKQLSKDAIHPPASVLNQFNFIPIFNTDNGVTIVLNVDSATHGSFLFTGNSLTFIGDPPIPYPGELALSDFQYLNGSMVSMQRWAYNASTNIKNSYFSDGFSSGTFKPSFNNYYYRAVEPFYHPFTHDLLSKVETGNLIDFFECVPNIIKDPITTPPLPDPSNKAEMFGDYNKGGHEVYNELATPYALYNWELFFHTPMMLGGSLSSAQNFEQAMKWYEYVFNPKAQGTDDQRFWRFWPFQQSNAQNYIQNLFDSLSPNTPNNEISMWRDNPFKPHVIARLRPAAYMKWAVMKYLDNLIAWGDYLFAQDTIESLNQATQLYVFASHILGERPQVIPQRGKIKPQTYRSLLGQWDAFGNAMVELELVFPYTNQAQLPPGLDTSVGAANIYGSAAAEYFCTPDNPNLTAYWDTVADRLYKIRHCENIDGVFSLPPLWDAVIDPGLLVNAAAQGLNIANVLNDMSTPVPNYRFNYLMQKSIELCGELKSMGNSLLSAFEKKDAETLANMRSVHETTMNNLVMQVKTMQLDEANKALEGLYQNRKGPVYRLAHYLQIIGEDLKKVPSDVDTDFTEIEYKISAPVDDSGLKLIPFEKEEMDKASEAQDWQKAIAVTELLASIFHAIPNLAADIKPVGVGAGATWGGTNLGNVSQAVAKGLQIKAQELSYQSGNAARKAGFTRQMEERVLQANNAGYEVKNIDKQIISQQIRIQIANQEITNQQQQIDNANEVKDFLMNKYTNDDLYTWMRDSIKTLYYQVYKLAYDLAKKAELVYRFDRGLTSSNFIQFGYWNAGRDGLLAGEQLFVGIKQLEAAYQKDRGYDFEVTKHISLRQVNPTALIKLRTTGVCEFEIPEVLFDMDFPGHYMRRIKSISVTIPCIVGPYTSVNATLRLVENKFRQTPALTGGYPETFDLNDSRFMTVNIPVTAIAASTAQNDSGVFELNFKDERYMPFEGAGAVSKWHLELPAGFKQFDYKTITDVIIQMRYTSVDGGDKLKKAAGDALGDYIGAVESLSQDEGLFTVFDIQHDFPTAWYKATQVPLPTTATYRAIALDNLADRLPIFTKGFTNIGITDVYLFTTTALAAHAKIGISGYPDFGKGINIPGIFSYALNLNDITLPVTGTWEIEVTDMVTPLNDMWMVMRYKLS